MTLAKINANLVHVMAFIAGIICYTILTATGHDGTPVLTATMGYVGGMTVEKVGGGAKEATPEKAGAANS